jgi:hypothetical protein
MQPPSKIYIIIIINVNIIHNNAKNSGANKTKIRITIVKLKCTNLIIKPNNLLEIGILLHIFSKKLIKLSLVNFEINI